MWSFFSNILWVGVLVFILIYYKECIANIISKLADKIKNLSNINIKNIINLNYDNQNIDNSLIIDESLVNDVYTKSISTNTSHTNKISEERIKENLIKSNMNIYQAINVLIKNLADSHAISSFL